MKIIVALTQGCWHPDNQQIPVRETFQQKIAKIKPYPLYVNILCAAEYKQPPSIIHSDKNLTSAGIFYPPSWKNLGLGRISYAPNAELVIFVTTLHECGHRIQGKLADQELITTTNRMLAVLKTLPQDSILAHMLYLGMPLEQQVRHFVSCATKLHPQRARITQLNHEVSVNQQMSL